MSALAVASVRGADFSADASLGDDGITAALGGNADLCSRDALDGFLHGLHGEATRLGVAEVLVDLRGLKFMNSSCFKAFVWWITTLEECAPEQQYKIRIRSDPGLHWQKRSLHALACFANELVTVQV